MQNKSHIKNKILLGIASACAVISFFISYINKTTTKELATSAEIKLHQKEELAEEKLMLLTHFLKTTKPEKLFIKYQQEIADLYKNEGIGIYVYQNDSLCFWSDNKPAIDLYSYSQNSKTQLIKIRNGWFECIIQADSVPENYRAIALIALKNEYDIENKYIKNNFADWLDLPEKTKLKTDFNYLNPTIKSKYGNALFEISRNDGVYKNGKLLFVSSIFAFFAFLIIILVVFHETKKRFENPILQLFVFAISAFILVTTMLYFRAPTIFYETKLYDATVFANGNSFYFSYLGSILINSFLFFITAVIAYKLDFSNFIVKKSSLFMFVFFGTIILSGFSICIRNVMFSLVNNSTITFNINELLNFSEYSLVCFLSIGFLMYAFYILCEKFVKIIMLLEEGKLLISIFSATILIVIYIISDVTIFDFLWTIPLVILCIVLRKFKASNNFINVGLIVLVSTILVTNLLNKFEKKNKQQTYDALSYSLTDRQDIIAENEFIKASLSIKSDGKLKNLISLLPLSSEQIEQSLRQNNLSGYFERYDIVLSLFKKDCTPIFYQNSPLYLNEDYFKQQIENDGSQTISDELFFIDKENKPIRYVAKLDLENGANNPENSYRLYIQMEPKNAIGLGSFPDLLLDKSLENKLELKQISYAVYDNNKLQISFGQFQYPLFIDNHFFDIDNNDLYNHYFYANNKKTKVIISDIKKDLWQTLTSISYLFIFFSVVILLSILFNSIVVKRENKFNSLNYRIQFILVSIVFLSLAGVVIGTVWVVESQFEKKNIEELVNKSRLVSKELQQSLGQENALEGFNKSTADFKLKKIAQLVGSDISLFGANGMLYSSSQPGIFQQGLISKFINPLAYSSFMHETQVSFSQRETIGALNYLSAYIPFYNNNDKLIGFINLPYFSRQKDLEKELTAYLTTLINIYTILFVITTLVALLVSNLLTKPLRIIKQQIADIKFGTHNEALKWHSKDEIGDLVNEYNLMLVKLEKNSQLLAQSERESAWREMAKQVAHEIKNPLTPMKLNIQHLQRVVSTNHDDIPERVNRVAILLIEQIDTLSHIATEFSNFAKLPIAHSEKINLYEVLQNVTNLFQQNTACDIELSEPLELPVIADKEQCIRIFTNLLKNAEQSISSDRKGQILINAFIENENIVITIKDNGCGIEEFVKHKIFTPNFTTKTTGTGLGLAMVKNSIVSFNGSISFETEVDSGTTFILKFPKAI